MLGHRRIKSTLGQNLVCWLGTWVTAANTRRSTKAGLMLAHRPLRRTIIKLILGQRLYGNTWVAFHPDTNIHLV